MAVSGFSDSKSVLVPTAGIFTWSKSQIRRKLLGTGETFEIPDLYKAGKCCLCFYTKEAGEMADVFLIFLPGCKFFNTFIKSLQLIRQLIICGKIFREDFLIKPFYLQRT